MFLTTYISRESPQGLTVSGCDCRKDIITCRRHLYVQSAQVAQITKEHKRAKIPRHTSTYYILNKFPSF